MDFPALVQGLDPQAKLRRSWPLTGGVSATVTALEFEQGGQIRRAVLRQYGQRDLIPKPDVAREEFGLLRFLHAASLPVPAPLAHAREWVLIEFIEGVNGLESPPPEVARALAAFLAQLHNLADIRVALPLSRSLGPVRGIRSQETALEGRIRAGLKRLLIPAGRMALLHGDLWPGNTLWQGAKLAAVIDWEDAALGDPLADVAVTRLELLSFHGPAIMQAFTDEYVRLSGVDLSGLAYWDLRAALRAAGHVDDWGLSFEERQTLQERHAWFVERAINQL